LQDDLPKLRETYLEVLQLTGFVSIPIAGMIFVLAPDFTRIFLGDKWMPMVPAMEVLCLYGLFRSFGALPGSVITALGRVSILPQIPFIQLIFIIILIYPIALKWGIVGVSSVVTLSVVLAVLWAIGIGNKYLSIRYITILQTLFPSIISSIIIIMIMKTINYFFINTIFLLLSEITVGAFIYILLQYKLTKRNLIMDLFRLSI
jgi:O-antigen/teichoic acid export membrane protein